MRVPLGRCQRRNTSAPSESLPWMLEAACSAKEKRKLVFISLYCMYGPFSVRRCTYVCILTCTDMKVIIPLTPAKIIPNNVSWLCSLTRFIINKPITAPSGCERPPIPAASQKALLLDFVAMYSGNAIMNPSMKLCIDMAMHTLRPSWVDAWLDMNIINPSKVRFRAILFLKQQTMWRTWKFVYKDSDCRLDAELEIIFLNVCLLRYQSGSSRPGMHVMHLIKVARRISGTVFEVPILVS